MMDRIKSSIIYKITIIILSISQISCQTIHENNKKAEKEAEIMATQKSLVVSFLNKGLPAMAMKELRKLINQHPEDPDFKNLMGLAQLSLQNPISAAKSFKESYALEPRTSVALNLSSAHIEAKKYKQAVSVLRAIKKSKDYKVYQYPERISHNLALAFERMGKIRAAEKHYRVALGENPNYYLSLMRLGKIYELSKRRNQAVGIYKKAKSACPVCFDPINSLVMSEVALGRHSSAMNLLRTYAGNKEVSDSNRNRARKMMGIVQRIAQSRTPNKQQRVRADLPNTRLER